MTKKAKKTRSRLSAETKECLSLFQETLMTVRFARIEEGQVNRNLLKQNIQLLWCLTQAPEKRVRKLAEVAFRNKDFRKQADAEQKLLSFK
jgi:hypothetical protein